MAFNADEYIGVIVEQIGGNFQELHDAIGNCEKFQKAQKEYLEFDMDNGDVEKFVELHDKYSLQKKSIGNLVCNYDVYKTIEPLSVGLFGEWGSGKTHLLKLIEQKVIHLQYEKKVFPQTTIPVFFNAWRFEKEEHLIVPLFQTLLASIENFDAKHLSEKVQKQLGRTKERLKILSFALAKGFQVPKNIKTTVATLMTGDLTAIADFIDTDKVAKAFKEGDEKAFVTEKSLTELLKSDRIESIYMNIPQWIEKITIADNINFVFLIDDLDRCLPENTLKMLESIKLFLDVPSCAFVLAIDDDVVERGVAYHYRDYLKDIVRVDGEIENQSQELPITGHEYLEKMIQLPFRIPVIDGTDVYDFLQKNYAQKFSELLKNNKDDADEVLKFFSETIPPKPRKIKRTAMLFQTKVNVLKALEQNVDYMVVAKVTLLELFAPKLLRFIQNNGYKAMFDILHDFSNLVEEEVKENHNGFDMSDYTFKSLSNSRKINFWIKEQKDEYKERIYTKLMDIVTENYHSRMVFNLDHIFNERIDKDSLTQVIEQKIAVKIDDEEKVLINLMSQSFKKLLFGESETQWRAAFDDHELFEEGKALLTVDSIVDISNEAKEKEGFCDNPKWLLIIAEYITQEQFIKLLEEIYPYEMNPYQTTFEEYDEYCKSTGVEKPKDEGWGRGKRPVINVSWEDATAYAKWLSEKEGVEYRLPTSDEWYLACNVGAKTKWHFGDDENLLKDYAWYNENSDGKTHSVGALKPNALGLYDMHGNVWEWCEDWYDKEKKYKAFCGGSWINNAFNTRSAVRDRLSPSDRYDNVGFRLLRTLP